MKWTTKDGTEILISEMTDAHILNCIKMFKRNAPISKELAIQEMIGCPMPNGDIASYYVSLEMDELFGADPLELLEQEKNYQALTAEAIKRGLTD